MHEVEKLNELQEWLLSSQLGSHILHHESIFYHNTIQHVFGYYALQINQPEIFFLQNSKISSNYILNRDIKTDLQCLPIKTNSIDLIICPHILEFMTDYQILLKEFYRILIPNGKLIITCFNKHSLINIFKPQVLKSANLISLNNLKKQLTKLNFNIDGGKFLSYCLPINNQKILSKSGLINKICDRWLPTFANNYAILASKQLLSPILVKPAKSSKNLELITQLSANYNHNKIKCKNR